MWQHRSDIVKASKQQQAGLVRVPAALFEWQDHKFGVVCVFPGKAGKELVPSEMAATPMDSSETGFLSEQAKSSSKCACDEFIL